MESQLPDDVLYNILLRTPYEDVFNLCKSNTRYHKLCDDNFWYNKSIYDFDKSIDITKYFNSTWSEKEKYQMLHYIVTYNLDLEDIKVLPLLVPNTWSPEKLLIYY